MAVHLVEHSFRLGVARHVLYKVSVEEVERAPAKPITPTPVRGGANHHPALRPEKRLEGSAIEDDVAIHLRDVAGARLEGKRRLHLPELLRHPDGPVQVAVAMKSRSNEIRTWVQGMDSAS